MRKLIALALMLLSFPCLAQTIHTDTMTLTVAQLTACNTTPITLLPATSGVTYFPLQVLAKRTGDRYETQPGELQVRYVTSAPFVHMRVDTQTGGLLTQRRAWLSSFGAAGGRYGADSAISVDVSGAAVQLLCSTGDPTTSLANPGSDVDLVFVYQTWATP